MLGVFKRTRIIDILCLWDLVGSFKMGSSCFKVAIDYRCWIIWFSKQQTQFLYQGLTIFFIQFPKPQKSSQNLIGPILAELTPLYLFGYPQSSCMYWIQFPCSFYRPLDNKHRPLDNKHRLCRHGSWPTTSLISRFSKDQYWLSSSKLYHELNLNCPLHQ